MTFVAHRIVPTRRRTALFAALAAMFALMTLTGSHHADAQFGRSDIASFQLFPAAKFLPCMAAPGQTPTVNVLVRREHLNDMMLLDLRGFKEGLQFDLFTVQRSNQNADGTPVQGFTNFGLAWYQSDIEIGGRATQVQVRTILLDQIFGFDPDAGLAPLNTFHVGFWFNNPADAEPCGFTGTTPFNGDHNAGPLAFISRPDATTNLGPLCTNPNTSTVPATCNP
jgi:hypothetical protein